MKTFFLIMACVCMQVKSFSQEKIKLKDGLYLVSEVVDSSTKPSLDKPQKVFITFDPLFQAGVAAGTKGLVIYASNFVPLELAAEPELINQTGGHIKLRLSFSPEASEQLAGFTSHNLMKEAAVVIDGKAVTVHKIRAAITGGKMEITSSTADGAETLYRKLKDHIKK